MPGSFTDLQFNTTTDTGVLSTPTGPHTIQIATVGAPASININTLIGDLANNDVLITTNTVADNGEAGDIDVNQPFNWTTGTTLTLEAAGGIIFGVAGGIAAEGTATLALEARGGSILQSALSGLFGSIQAGTLTGFSSGDTILPGENSIKALGQFSTGSSNFLLNNNESLSITGAVTASIFDLSARTGVDEVAGGQIIANKLQSSFGVSAPGVFGDAILTSTSNEILTLGAFRVASGDFNLVDNVPLLAIDGAVSAQHISITNVFAGGEILHVAEQTLVISGATSGTFTLSFKGATTGPLAATASAADIQTALDGLSTIGGVGGSVFVGQVGSGSYAIEFTGALAQTIVPLITTSASGGTTTSVALGDQMSATDVTLTADQMALDSAISATDVITLAPNTGGTQVTLGGSHAPTGLTIDNAELATLTAPTLLIGSLSTGQINIGTANIASAMLDLFTGAGISSAGGALSVGGGTGTLRIIAHDTVDLFSGGMDIGTIEGQIAGDFKFQEHAAHALTVNAISSSGGEIVVQDTHGDLIVAQGVDSTGATNGNILLDSDSGAHTSSLILDAAVKAQTADIGLGDIGLVASGGGISGNSGLLFGHDLIAMIANSSTGAISLGNAAQVVTGHVDLNAGRNGGDISFADLSGYTIGGLGSITFASIGETLAPSIGAGIRTSASASVTLSVGGNVSEASGTGDIVSTGTLNVIGLFGNPNVTLDNSHNVVGHLGAISLGSGAFTLNNSTALTVDGAVSVGVLDLSTQGGLSETGSGAITASTLQSSAGVLLGDVTLTSTSNNIAALGDFPVTSSGPGHGNLTLIDNTTALTITGPVNANAITLTNIGGAIVQEAEQSLVVSGSTAGSFTLTFEGQTTGPLSATASAAAVQSALDALSTIGAGNAAVTQTGRTYTITFVNALAQTDLPLITATASGGTNASVAIANDIAGVDVTLLADQMALDGAINATDMITLAPHTAGTALTLGDSGVPAGLVVHNANLSTLIAPALTIGSAAAGPITVGAATVGSNILNLVSGAGISSNNAALTIGGGSGTVNVAAAGTVDLLGSIKTGAIGGSTTSGDFDVALNNAATLTVHAITTPGTQILVQNFGGGLAVDGALSGGIVTLTAGSNLTLAAAGSIASTLEVMLQVGTSAALDGVISGSGGLSIAAGGIVTLTATDSYAGFTTVASGTLLVDGSIATSVETDVRNGATLGGHGAVGALHVFGGGTLSPGDSPGVLTTGNVTLDAGAHFHEEIGGRSAGSFDQMQVHGTVNLGGATLDLSLVNGFVPSPGDSFRLIDNDGSDPVIGTFTGLAEGAHITLGGVDFALSYHGGDGNDITLTAAGGVPNPPAPPQGGLPGDFNADKVGDLLWQGPGSAVAEWLMNGGAISANLGVGSDAGLHFLDTADFTADGRSDVLWRDDGGNVFLWTMNGAQITANQMAANIGGDWQSQGAADFDGDGHADALWRNGGQVALWTMNGAHITANQIVTSNLGSDWHIQGLGDFNDDGRSDVLLRSSSSGQVVLWSMNGAQITANQSVANLGLDWHVLGTGDFTGDGKSDVLLRNDSGQVVLWSMNGAQITANQNVGNIDASWHLQNVSDYTGDGHADVLWRNDNGQLALWEMNGAQIVSDHTVGYANGAAASIDQSWSVLHHQFDLV